MTIPTIVPGGAQAVRGLRYSDVKSLCQTLRSARTQTLSLATWASVSANVDTIAAASGRDEDGIIIWFALQAGLRLFKCADCNGWRDNAQSHMAGDDRICEFCREYYCTCDECDDLVHEDSGHSINGGDRWLCDGCAETYRTCTSCGHEGDRHDMFRDGDDWYCEDHVPDDDDEENDDDDGIYSHEADILDILDARTWLAAPGENTDRHGNGKAKLATLWMGFELEVVARDSRYAAAQAIKAELKGRGLLKTDGSIPENGFEIVSLPATLAYHQTQWGEGFFDTLSLHMRGWREKSCGMHVHLSRDALTPLQIARLQVFVNGDGVQIDNRRFIEKIAGRGATEYSRHYNKRLTDCAPVIERHIPVRPAAFETDCDCASCRIQREAYDRALEASQSSDSVRHQLRQLRRTGPLSRACHDRAVDDRYQAINLQNSDTIEIRIFQSNVARLGFLKNIEFCHAAAKFCADAGNTALQDSRFLIWLDRRRGEYPNLTRWAVRESLIARRHADRPGVAAPALAA